MRRAAPSTKLRTNSVFTSARRALRMTDRTYQPARSTTRAVWRAVSARPNASYRELADDCQIAWSQVCAAMKELIRLGYVEQTPGRCRARRVLVPMVDA